MKRLLIAVIAVIALALVAGACGADSSESDGSFVGEELNSPEAFEETSAQDGPDSGARVLAQDEVQSPETNRKIITNVNLSLVSEDPQALYDKIVALAKSSGGFVSNAQLSYPSGDTETDPFVSLTLRIPSASVEQTLETVEGLADRVVQRNIFTDDVTEQYFDLEARITNLTLLETELQTLLSEVRQAGSTDTEDLLRVFNEISRVRGDLEVLEGRRRLLADQVDLATVQISIEPKSEFTPFVDEWKPLQVAKSALEDLGGWLKDIADFVIRLVLLNGPVLLIMAAIAYFLVWRPLRWILKRVKGAESGPFKGASKYLASEDDEAQNAVAEVDSSE